MSTAQNITKIEVRYVPDAQVAEVTRRPCSACVRASSPWIRWRSRTRPGFEHTKRSVNHPKNLETIYKAFQVVDGTDDERCAQLKIRSMSYGDAIVFNGVAYYVAADGFVTIDGDTLVPVVEPQAAA
jgi:hypothetical protein